MIRVENLSKQLNKRKVLSQIDFHLEEGDVLGIIGPNGAGKSTLLSLLGGFMKADEGTIHKGSHRIGYIPQQLALYEDLSVVENLKLFGVGSLSDDQALMERIEAVISALNLTENRDVKVKKLSGGNKRRVNIGIALMIDPTCLLMDEPVVGVDYKVRSDIENLLKEMSASGKTLIIASHLKSFIAEVSTKLLILEEGKVAYFGDVNEEALSKL
jgi:ABC-2 type transport system ATP-binding protein